MYEKSIHCIWIEFGSTLGTDNMVPIELETLMMKIIQLEFRGGFAGNEMIHQKGFLKGWFSNDWGDLSKFDDDENINCATFTYKLVKEVVDRDKLDRYFFTDWVRAVCAYIQRRPWTVAIVVLITGYIAM